MRSSNIHFPQGFYAWGIASGIKSSGEADLGILTSSPAARAFGLFTQNHFAAPPVQFCRQAIANQLRISHIIVNSGNANAFTGSQGLKDVRETADLVKSHFPNVENTLVCSTGIIGKYLPMPLIRTGINKLSKSYASGNYQSFAKAIITTDTVLKTVQKSIILNGKSVKIGGAVKGAGMICPNVATMLAFITTDINLPYSYSKKFSSLADKSFNSISVDGDMSTNDTVLLLSNGCSGVNYSSLSKKDKHLFDEMLFEQFQQLAIKVVQDGEGATKLIRIDVTGAGSYVMAKDVCRSIANSPLVKTAFFGSDPNWGRIIAAFGSLQLPRSADTFTLKLCGSTVIQQGQLLPFDEKSLSAKLQAKTCIISLDLNSGNKKWTYWTCDLSYEYVKVNADYHT